MIRDNFIPIHHKEGDCHYIERWIIKDPFGQVFRCRFWMQDLGNPPEQTKSCVKENPTWKCIQLP